MTEIPQYEAEDGNQKLSRNCDCDIDIMVKGKIFSTHRSLLAQHSTYFEGKFAGDFKYEQRISLDSVTENGLDWCIDYMYEKRCPPKKYGIHINSNFANLTEALRAAHFLGMAEFKDKCQELFCTHVKAENALELVQILDECGSAPYIDRARQFVKNNLDCVIDQANFCRVHENDFFFYISGSDARPAVIWKAIRLWIEGKDDRKSHAYTALDKFCALSTDVIPILPGILKYCLDHKMDQCRDLLLREQESKSVEVIARLDFDPKLCLQFLMLAKCEGFRSNWLAGIREKSREVLASNMTLVQSGYIDIEFEDFQKILLQAEVTNKTKWDLIVAWVEHDKVRQHHVIDLIKTLDLPAISKEFIEEIRSASIVQNSAESLNFLFDLREQKFGTIKVLAILDDKRDSVALLNTSNLTYAEINLPKNCQTNARIASLSNELYVLSKGQLHKLTHHGPWEMVCTCPHNPSWSQFVPFSNKLALVAKKHTILFKPTNINYKTTAGCELADGFSSTGTETSIYAVGGYFSTGYAKKYTSKDGWIDLPNMPLSVNTPEYLAATAYYRGELYVMGSSHLGLYKRDVLRFDGKKWTVLSDMIHRRASFDTVVFNDKLYVLGGRSEWLGGWFSNNDIIEEYISQSNEWKEVGRTEFTKGIVSVAVCDINPSNFKFQSWKDGPYKFYDALSPTKAS